MPPKKVPMIRSGMSLVLYMLGMSVRPAPIIAALKRLGLRHDPAGHVAAVTPALERELVGIRDAARDHRVDARHDVAVIAAAPVLEVRLLELLAVVRCCRAGSDKAPPTPRRPNSGCHRRSRRDSRSVCAPSRAAVRHDHQRIASSLPGSSRGFSSTPSIV